MKEQHDTAQAAPAAGAVAGPTDDEILNRTGTPYAPGTREYDLDLIRWYRERLAAAPTPAAQAAECVPAGPRRKDMLWSTAKMQERHDQRIENIVSGLERIKQEHAGQQPQKIDECYGDCPTDSTTCTNPCRFDGRAARDPAESVLEDAARLDFLIEQRAYVVSDPDACPGYWLHFINKETGKCWVQGDEHPTPRAAIDAAMKKGANHD